MHIVIDDQESGATLTLCVDRNSHSCTVLRGALELLPTAVTLAENLKAPHIRILVVKGSPEHSELVERGWSERPEVTMEKRLNTRGANGRKTG